jgi:hypothetical protein
MVNIQTLKDIDYAVYSIRALPESDISNNGDAEFRTYGRLNGC